MEDEALQTPVPPETRTERRARSTTPRRRWLRRFANLMIVVGVLLLAYPLATWAYTWFEQRSLREELIQSDPRFAMAAEALEETDFIPAVAQGTPAVPVDPTDPEAIALAERMAQWEMFEAAATKYAAEVGWKEGTPLGRIVLPTIGMDVVMIEGTDNGDLREGPGHWPETPFPGEGGNFVVSGHRTTYGAPFRKLGDVRVGDAVYLVLPYGVVSYIVTRVIIVYPKEIESVAQIGKEQVSLAACHPIYSAKQRIVVQGDLTGFKLVGS